MVIDLAIVNTPYSRIVISHRDFQDTCYTIVTDHGTESAFAPSVGFGVLMTSKLGTNVILMRYVAAISPMKDSKS
jgi:hypothetical protein